MDRAQEVLKQLRDGNRRFVAGEGRIGSVITPLRRTEVAPAQSPSAVVLGCSDSRVPPEVVFDQGLGDLFVVRVAGNVAAPSVIKSIEFAVGQFDVPLIVVMGHTNCGATQTPRANTCASAEELRTRTGLLGERVRRGELLVACAEYSLSTGVVDFFDRSL